MITANELKTKGVKALDEKFKKSDEIGITVRGKMKYVVVKVEDYDDYYEYRIQKAHQEVKAEIAAGEYSTSMEEHFAELDEVVQDAGNSTK